MKKAHEPLSDIDSIGGVPVAEGIDKNKPSIPPTIKPIDGMISKLNRRQRDEILRERNERKQSLLNLFITCECQHQMHRLAQEYYAHRDTWLHFLPLTVLTLVSGTLAFLGSSDLIPVVTKEFLSLAVGICSIVSVAIQSCAKHSKYAARSEMHRAAALGMKKLADNATFNQLDPEQGITD